VPVCERESGRRILNEGIGANEIIEKSSGRQRERERERERERQLRDELINRENTTDTKLFDDVNNLLKLSTSITRVSS
jgi:hypothetical protein